jgi:molybdopterin adenylyltransferase
MGHDGHDEDDHGHRPHPRPHHRHGHAHPPGHHLAHPAAGSPTAAAHKAGAPATVSAFVVTCSDTRSVAEDETGRLILQRLEGAGHAVCGHRVIRDEPSALRAVLQEASAAGARAVIVSGGTGIGRRDQTVETLRPLFEKELPGFGELFRYLSWKDIGAPAMMTRAVAGTLRGMIVFALPGSPNAVKLAMEALILPELGHAVRELTR